MGKRYSGEFLSRQDVRWRVVIYQEGYEGEVHDLDFSADDAVVIEWPETSKYEAVVGSTCTVTVISPSDRAFTDLYTEGATDIQIVIYRDNSVYWQGVLDAEQYEEPYETLDGYEVRLVASDFGVLDRLDWESRDVQTIHRVIRRCWEKITGATAPSFGTHISTQFDGRQLWLEDIYVDGNNFFDEDGEPMSMRAVLEGVLRPLGLRIEQRERLWVYDLNGLFADEPRRVSWSSTTQDLGVDAIYNKCQISFEPNVRTGDLLSPELLPGVGRIDPNITNRNRHQPTVSTDGLQGWSYPAYPETNLWGDPYNVGFTMWVSEGEPKGVTLRKGVKAARLVPQLSGEERDIIAIEWPSWSGGNSSGGIHGSSGTYGRITTCSVQYHGVTTQDTLRSELTDYEGLDAVTAIVETDGVHVQRFGSGFALKIGMDVMSGSSPNPYESDYTLPVYSMYLNGNKADSQNYAFDGLATILCIPVAVTLEGDDGSLWFWQEPTGNRNLDYGVSVWERLGAWVQWDGELAHALSHLTAYPSDLPDNDDGRGTIMNKGWSQIRQNLGWFVNPSKKALQKSNDGQVMPPPPVSGIVKVHILDNGWYWRKRDDDSHQTGLHYDPFEWPGCMQWLLVSAPEISAVPKYYGELDSDSVEYKGSINPNAKDSLDIETVCGTAPNERPMALGLYLTADGLPLATLERGGREARPEVLLIGTMYSQHAKAHRVLRGEMDIDCVGVHPFDVATEPGKKFIRLATLQNCILGTEDATLVELSADEYTADVEGDNSFTVVTTTTGNNRGRTNPPTTLRGR